MSEENLTGHVVAGKYLVVRRLGQGGMGVVYEAKNVVTGKRVALKCLHSELSANHEANERFMREARAASRIQHSNVVDLYDVIEHAHTIFLVMEYLEGESLGDYLDRGEQPVASVLRLLIDAMRGLSAAHKQGIVHRDLKPDNIFLARESDDGALTPKLLDFGIAKLLVLDTGQMRLTRTGLTFGTPRYTSYEQLMGRSDVDARADVYSFGVILYEALTGQAPYPALNFQQLLVQFTSIKPVPPRQHRPELPAALEALILRALSLDREARPASIDALIAGLKPFLQNEPAPPVLTVVPSPVRALESAPTAPLLEHTERPHSPMHTLTVAKAKIRSVPPRREHAVDMRGRSAPPRQKGALHYAWAIAGCALFAIVLWLLKPSDAELAAQPAPTVQGASMGLPLAEKLVADPQQQPSPAPVTLPVPSPIVATKPARLPPGLTGPKPRLVPTTPRAAAPRLVNESTTPAPSASEIPINRARRRVPLPTTDQF